MTIQTHTFEMYNPRHLSKPWGVKLTLVHDGFTQVDRDFTIAEVRGGATDAVVMVDVNCGDVYAVGQDGKAGNPGYIDYYIALEPRDGQLSVSEADAIKYLQGGEVEYAPEVKV